MVENSTGNGTGAKDMPLKSTGNEKLSLLSVCLTVKANGTKMKPFVVFQCVKRETDGLNEKFNHCCIVESSLNGWTNEELTLLYLKRVIDSFSVQKRLLVWAIFKTHLSKPVKYLLEEMRIADALIAE